jgi:hypothetical protein
VNYVYAYLAKGRDAQQLAELDRALAPTPEAKQLTIDQQNAAEMRKMAEWGAGGMSGPKPVPLPHKRRRPDG